MTHRARPVWTGDTIESLATYARLDLPAPRRQEVAESLDAAVERADVLDRVDLGETPPATAFDARWE